MGTPRSAPLTPGDDVGGPGTDPAGTGAASGVTELYRAHAVGLIRLAIVMLGDRAAAEDVVQDAFLGLYRHWARLADPASALAYARSAVLNRCRNELRQRGRPGHRPAELAASESAEAAVLIGEEHKRVLAAIRALPDRQREALVRPGSGSAACAGPRRPRSPRRSPSSRRNRRAPTSGGPGLDIGFYLLTITPGGTPAVKLSQLPMEPLPGVIATALSASGKELAVATANEQVTGGPVVKELAVYSVATGRPMVSWSTADTAAIVADTKPGFTLGRYTDQYPALSWIHGDQQIAFPELGGAGGQPPRSFRSRCAPLTSTRRRAARPAPRRAGT